MQQLVSSLVQPTQQQRENQLELSLIGQRSGHLLALVSVSLLVRKLKCAPEMQLES